MALAAVTPRTFCTLPVLGSSPLLSPSSQNHRDWRARAEASKTGADAAIVGTSLCSIVRHVSRARCCPRRRGCAPKSHTGTKPQLSRCTAFGLRG